MTYINLNVKSCYSFLSSSLKIEDIVKYAKDNNQKAIALTDVNVMFGCLEFFNRCQENDIVGIVGMEVLVDEINGNKRKDEPVMYHDIVTSGIKAMKENCKKAMKVFAMK